MSKLSLNASKKTKQTTAGVIPVDWGCSPLESVAVVQTGLSKSGNRSGAFVRMPYLRVANVQDGHFNLEEIKEIDVPKDQVERFLVRKGDLLLTEGGDFDKLGRGAVWGGQIAPCAHQNHLFVVRGIEGVVDQRFLAAYTQSRKGKAYFQSCSKQSTNLASINSSQLKKLPVVLPPLPEQRKIADILSTWDEALETLDTLISAKERQKQALMQQLLNRSSSKATKGHARHRLGEICERVTRKNGVSSDNVLTISAQGGLVDQRDYFNRSVAGADLSGYYLLNRGEFAYNRSSAKGYPYGAIKRLDHYECGVVSTLYLCFRIKQKVQVDSNYLYQYFESGKLNSGLRSVAKEGARAHGLLNVTADEFFDIDIFLPTIAEQQQIAAILDTADQELTLLRTQRQTLDQQKRGLMQRLLTGKIRVNLNNLSRKYYHD